jgi:carboxypeptidase D
VEEVTIWLNGGPGCSSLIGFFQENGPFTWQPGTLAPVQNPYAWSNLTNMLWVDQPVGTGYTTGNVTATSQYETAQDFVKFFKNWEQIFGIKNYKIYVAGESYAGRYVPYISAAMLDQNDTTYFNLSGALTYGKHAKRLSLRHSNRRQILVLATSMPFKKSMSQCRFSRRTNRS